MTEQHTAGARAWLEEVLGADGAVPQASAWDQFAASDRPVVTLFGAYDTGKSALVRRLLVDAGLEVPEWVTISARHETFEVGAIDFRGVSLRDTPGLAPGADDARAVANTAQALQAAGLTDVLVVMMNPQLPTAERGLLISAAGRSLAGRLDPPGHLEVRQHRRQPGVRPRRLPRARRPQGHRAAEFALARSGPAGAGRFSRRRGRRRRPAAAGPVHLGRARPWDGMAQLARHDRAVADADLSDLRAAAEERYWIGARPTRPGRGRGWDAQPRNGDGSGTLPSSASRRLPRHPRRARARGAHLYRRRGRGGHSIDHAPPERRRGHD